MSNSPILIGQCCGTWGLQGSLKLISWSSPKESIFRYRPWYLSNKEALQVKKEDLFAREVSHSKVLRSGRSLAVNFVGIDSLSAAAPLQGQYIYIFSEQLVNIKDEYYWCELIGMSVVNEQQETLGQVIEILPTGVHDVLKVQNLEKDGKKNHLIPFVRQRYILSIDREGKQIYVSWDSAWT